MHTFFNKSKASTAFGFFVLSGCICRDFFLYVILMSFSAHPGSKSNTSYGFNLNADRMRSISLSYKSDEMMARSVYIPFLIESPLVLRSCRRRHSPCLAKCAGMIVRMLKLLNVAWYS